MVKPKRKLFPFINTYQGKIVFSVFVSALVLHLCLFVMLTILHMNLGMLIIEEAPTDVVAGFIDSWSFTVILISLFFVMSVLVITFIISRNLVGAFERVIRELDDILEGRKETPVAVRKHDSLAQELLKRVNKIIVAGKAGNG